MESLRGTSIAESLLFVAILSSEALSHLIRPDSVIVTFEIEPQYQPPFFSVNCSLLSSCVEKGKGSLLT